MQGVRFSTLITVICSVFYIIKIVGYKVYTNDRAVIIMSLIVWSNSTYMEYFVPI